VTDLACQCLDLNSDGFIDMIDLPLFKSSMSGAHIPRANETEPEPAPVPEARIRARPGAAGSAAAGKQGFLPGPAKIPRLRVGLGETLLSGPSGVVTFLLPIRRLRLAFRPRPFAVDCRP